MEVAPGTWAYIGFVLSVIALIISIIGFFIGQKQDRGLGNAYPAPSSCNGGPSG